MPQEEVIWEGSQSQILNFGTYIVMLIIALAIIFVGIIFFPFLTALAVIPASIALYKFILTKSQRYRVTNERIMFITGIFSKKTDSLELYRVRDIDIYEPFILRMFKLGNIELISSDTTTPKFLLKAVPKPKELLDKLRTAVEKRRDVKRVRGVEFENDMGTL